MHLPGATGETHYRVKAETTEGRNPRISERAQRIMGSSENETSRGNIEASNPWFI